MKCYKRAMFDQERHDQLKKIYFSRTNIFFNRAVKPFLTARIVSEKYPKKFSKTEMNEELDLRVFRLSKFDCVLN